MYLPLFFNTIFHLKSFFEVSHRAANFSEFTLESVKFKKMGIQFII